MPVQSVNTTKNTANAAISQGVGELLAIMGPSSVGPNPAGGASTSSTGYDTPIAITRPQDVVTAFGIGPLVEAACLAIKNYSSTVLCLRTHATTAGSAGAVNTTRAAVVSPEIASTSVVTIDSGSVYLGDFEIGLIVTKVVYATPPSPLPAVPQGTLGTDKIYVQWSLDNFRTLSSPVALPGTGPFALELANTPSNFDSGIKMDFAAGTLSVGDNFTAIIKAPAATTTDLATATPPLAATTKDWECVLLASEITDSTPSTGVCGTMDAFIASMFPRGLFRWWASATSLPTVTAGVAETDATYQASAVITNFSAYGSTTPAPIFASGVLTASGNPAWPAQYILPPSYGVMPWIKSLAEEQSAADKTLGPIPGLALVDGNGNPLGRCHSEELNPGLDDSRFCVLRGWSDRQGVYLNLPTLMAANGSPFTNLQRLRLWNLFARVVWTFFTDQLQKRVPYTLATGIVLKSYADRLEALANSAINTAIIVPGKVQDAKVSVLRTDDQRVANPKLSVSGGIQCFAYDTYIDLNLGFLLPG